MFGMVFFWLKAHVAPYIVLIIMNKQLHFCLIWTENSLSKCCCSPSGLSQCKFIRSDHSKRVIDINFWNMPDCFKEIVNLVYVSFDPLEVNYMQSIIAARWQHPVWQWPLLLPIVMCVTLFPHSQIQDYSQINVLCLDFMHLVFWVVYWP